MFLDWFKLRCYDTITATNVSFYFIFTPEINSVNCIEVLKLLRYTSLLNMCSTFSHRLGVELLRNLEAPELPIHVLVHVYVQRITLSTLFCSKDVIH